VMKQLGLCLGDVRRMILAALGLLLLAGCGGQISDSFANSIYIQIQSGGTLSPNAAPVRNGYRIVFLNHDSVRHTINWNSPLTLSAVAEPGDRAWFELPPMFPGTVLGYHLDTSGAGGTVTTVSSE
jgi:hypothetical protein